jgi:hypothetical protein
VSEKHFRKSKNAKMERRIGTMWPIGKHTKAILEDFPSFGTTSGPPQGTHVDVGTLVWDLWFGNFGLGTLVWELWFGIFGLGSLVWDLWFGNLGLGALVLELWFGSFGLGTLVWDLVVVVPK